MKIDATQIERRIQQIAVTYRFSGGRCEARIHAGTRGRSGSGNESSAEDPGLPGAPEFPSALIEISSLLRHMNASRSVGSALFHLAI